MGLRVSMSCSRSVPFWFGWSRKRNFPRICIRNGSLDMSFNYRLHLYNSTQYTRTHTPSTESTQSESQSAVCASVSTDLYVNLYHSSAWLLRHRCEKCVDLLLLLLFFYFYYSCRTRNNKSHHIHTPHCNIYSGQIVMASIYIVSVHVTTVAAF